MRNFLFIGAHPDDIEFGCGGTIAKAVAEGIRCHTLVLSDCHESLPAINLNPKIIVNESIEALKLLGISDSDMRWLDFPVRNFDKHRGEILDILVKDYREIEWERIFIPNQFDIHQDHSVVTEEAMRAFKFFSIYGYELPWNNYQSDIKVFNSLDIEHVDLKCMALAKFETQEQRFYSHESKVRAVLNFRGLQINEPYAEGFELIRSILA
jgi:LmbE family N-acetylglucosaminyl deacetylase